MGEVIKNRYEFTVFYEVENGNPNGDPDAGNMPRIDAETGYGIVTDVCIKRKIRNYVDIAKSDALGYKIYVKENIPLDINRKWAYESNDIEPPQKGGKISVDAPEKEEYLKVTKFMCDNFFDIRTFGAVMTLKYNCGQVRGPVQLGFSKSCDIVVPQEIGITSCTSANEGDNSSTMGRKHIIPYALYRVDGFVSPNLATKTGFTEEDLELLWKALVNMFDVDHAAARGKMSTRKLYVFKHDNELGNCPAYQLFETITVNKPSKSVARSFSDYTIKVDEEAIPSGVELINFI